MTANVHPSLVDAIDLAEAWFVSLGKMFHGRLRADDPVLAAGSTGWLIATLGRELAIIVDLAFPFTRPSVYLRGKWPAMPHVECDGRLCLRNPEIPADPATAIRLAVSEARDLLRAIAEGAEDEDFEEDFLLYWRQSADEGTRARLLLPNVRSSGLASWTTIGAVAYGFASSAALRRWWSHRFGTDRTKIRQSAIVALDRLPRPDLYPRNGSELWNLASRHSSNGIEVLSAALQPMPKALLVILTGTAPSGRQHAVALALSRPIDARGRSVNRRVLEHEYARGKTPADVLCKRYRMTRLETEALDASETRLPYIERDRLAASCVAVVGCGALGSGVARLLAKSGVGHLILVDPELLGWENIRRHQLGAGFVGIGKATGMARAIKIENPDIGSVKDHGVTIEKLLVTNAGALDQVNLVVACTASWSANSALDAFAMQEGRPPILYGWMEANAVAAHAVLIGSGRSYRSGFDMAGNPRLTASISSKPIPAECGASTSPFGAVELSHAEALTTRLALDFLRRKVTGTVWKTWLTDEEALAGAEGSWTDEWIAARGCPNPQGQVVVADWW